MAERIADSFQTSGDNVVIEIKAKQFMGILKKVPLEFHDGLQALIPNCIKAECCGLSLTFKLSFATHNDREFFYKSL